MTEDPGSWKVIQWDGEGWSCQSASCCHPNSREKCSPARWAYFNAACFLLTSSFHMSLLQRSAQWQQFYRVCSTTIVYSMVRTCFYSYRMLYNHIAFYTENVLFSQRGFTIQHFLQAYCVLQLQHVLQSDSALGVLQGEFSLQSECVPHVLPQLTLQACSTAWACPTATACSTVEVCAAVTECSTLIVYFGGIPCGMPLFYSQQGF